MSERLGYFEGIRFLSKYLRKHGREFFLFFLGSNLEMLLGVVTPIVFSVMIDQIVYYRDIGLFVRIGLVFVAMTAFSCLLYFLIYTFHHYLMSMYSFDIKKDIFRKFLVSSAACLSDLKSGEMINHLIYDSAECMHFVIRNVIHNFNGIVKGVFYLAYLYTLDWRAGLVVTLFLPVAAIVTLKQKDRIRDAVESERSSYGGYVSWLFEMLKGIVDIRLLRAEGKVRQDFGGHQRRLASIRLKTLLASYSSDGKIGIMNQLLTLTVFCLCAYLSYLGEISIGNVLVLVAFVTALNESIVYGAVRYFMDAQARLARIAKIREFMEREDETEWPGADELSVTLGEVEFRDVRFSYEGGSEVFAGLSCAIAGGSHAALVGQSGCGKSTFANLLVGFYAVQSGDILVDGKSIYECSLHSIRRNVGIVQQDILLFDATVRENLLLGNLGADDERIWDACEKAGIADFVRSLAGGLDTPLGKGGTRLSGGQRQRIEIARIYLKDPAILVFDEATSALDEETERLVHAAWKDLLAGRTAIVISHRESSVLLCDEALIIEDGKARRLGDPAAALRLDEAAKSLFAVAEDAV